MLENVSGIGFHQTKEIKRALLSTGEYFLSEAYHRYQVNPHTWSGKSAAERRVLLDEFISLQRPSVKGMISSTDGNLSIPTTPSAGKKPHQMQRRRAARTKPKNIIQ